MKVIHSYRLENKLRGFWLGIPQAFFKMPGEFTRKKDSEKPEKVDKREKISVSIQMFMFGVSKFK